MTFTTLANNDSTIVVSGNISGSGTMNFTQSSGSLRGTVILSGDNSFSGTFIPDTRTDLIVQNADSVKNMTTLRASSGGFYNNTGSPLTTTAWLDVRTNMLFGGDDLTIGRLHLHRAWTVTISTLNVQSGTTVTFANSDLTGNTDAMLRKLGAGTLVLQNMNMDSSSANAGIEVNAGTLIFNSNAGTNTAPLSVAAGAVLGGTGTLGGVSTITGSLRPGNSIGTLSTNNDVIWTGEGAAGTDDWVFELGAGGTSDLLAITGSFLKGAGETYIFDFADTGTPGVYTLVSWTSDDDLSGGVAGTSFLISDFDYTGLDPEFDGSFFAFDDGSLTFTVIPEPSAIALIVAAFAALVTIRRRR